MPSASRRRQRRQPRKKATVIGDPRIQSVSRYLDTVVATRRSVDDPNRHELTYYKWTRRGLVGDRRGHRDPVSFKEVVSDSVKVEVFRRGHAMDLLVDSGLYVLPIVVIAFLFTQVPLLTFLAGVGIVVWISMFLYFGDFGTETLLRSIDPERGQRT